MKEIRSVSLGILISITVAFGLAGNSSAQVPLAYWGDNTHGQLNLPAGLSNVAAVAAGGFHSLALLTNGTVVAWGDNESGQINIPAGLSSVKAISGGFEHSMALMSNGTVIVWGSDQNTGGASNVPPGLTNVVAISGGLGYHCLALRSDTTVAAWGYNNAGQTTVPNGLSNVVAVSAGGFHSLALKNNGTVVAWGNNSGGEINVPGGLANVKSIAAGYYYSMALQSNGNVVVWGNDQNKGATNVPAGLANVAAISAGYYHGLALKNDGTVVTWGDNSRGQTNVPAGLANVASIYAGGYFNLVLTNPPPPPNDQCSGAITLTEQNYYTVTTTTATAKTNVSNCYGTIKGIWYKYTPVVVGSTPVTITTSDTAVVQVYTGSCGSLSLLACNLGKTITFQGGDNTTYYILVGGNGVPLNGTGLVLDACHASSFTGFSTYSEDVDGGTLVYYQAFASGSTPSSYSWSFADASFQTLFSTNSTSDTISHLYGPFDVYPTFFNITVNNPCGSGGGSGSPNPPCGSICLSVGAPNTVSGSVGGANPYSLNSPCATFGANSHWFRIVSTNLGNTIGSVIVTMTGGDTNAVLGVFKGPITDLANLAPVVCNAASSIKPGRVQFQAQPGVSYWLAVNATSMGTVNYWCFQSPTVLAQWNFNNTSSPVGSPAPSVGSGTLTLTGGTHATYGDGTGSSDPSYGSPAWSTAGYPAQGTANKSAGIQFKVNTAGYQNIALSWDQYSDGTSSRYYRLQWSTNGTTFTNFPYPVTLLYSGDFESQYLDLSAIPDVNNKTNLTLRIVSEFQSTAANTGNVNYVTTYGTYNTAGVTQFDMLTVVGTPIPKITNPVFHANQFSFGVGGLTGYQYTVQASSNLTTWVPLGTYSAPFTFTDPNTGTQPRRYYRILTQP